MFMTYLTELPYFDIVHLGSVLHLLNETDSRKAVENSWKILTVGGIFIGQTVGAVVAGTFSREAMMAQVDNNTNQPVPPLRANQAPLRFLHSIESLSQLLQSVGFVEVDVRWKAGKEQQGSKMGLLVFFGVKI